LSFQPVNRVKIVKPFISPVANVDTPTKKVVLIHEGTEHWFDTFYDAAQEAVMGDQIIVKANITETQPVEFNEIIGLHIRGEGRVTVTWQGDGYWLRFKSSAWYRSFNNHIENLIIYCNGNSGIRVEDSYLTTLRDITVVNPNVGIELATVNQWCEATNLENVYIRDPQTGIKLAKYGGTGSFALTKFDHVFMALSKASSVGIDIDGNSVSDRSFFDHVNFWVVYPANNAVCLKLNGGMDRAIFNSLCFEIPDDTQYPTGVIGLQFGSNFSGNVCFIQEPVFFPWNRFYKTIDNPYGKQFTCYARDILGKPPFKVRKITGTSFDTEDLVVFNEDSVDFNKHIKLKAGNTTDYLELIGGKDTYKYLYIPNAGLGTAAYPLVWVDAQILYSQALMPLDNNSDFLVYPPANAKLRFTGDVYIDSLPDM